MAWILLRLSNCQQVALLVRTGGSRHSGLAAPPHRNIHYVFETSENNYCVISYSCARSCFYQIRSFTEEEQNARNQSNTEMAKNRNLEYVIIDM